MAHRMTPSQFRSQVQQLQNTQRQFVDNYNRAIRAANEHNRKVVQAVNDHKRKVAAAVDDYNRTARAHNARLYADRQRLERALSHLQSRRTIVTTYATFQRSVESLHYSYEALDRFGESRALDKTVSQLLDMSERENANSLDVMNALLAGGQARRGGVDDLARLRETRIGVELVELSHDLDGRWRGALFALHPDNPDASRHFCTSAREIFTDILERRAPDIAVKQDVPNCPTTPQGKPTRRAKIHFALKRKGLVAQPLEEFADQDAQNIIELFDVFNDGTHGSAGRYAVEQLRAIKTRVEDGILYLSRIFK